MIYNILIIDDLSLKDKYIEYLNCLDNKDICFPENTTELTKSFEDNNFHIVLLNDDILSIDSFYEIFSKSYEDYQEIPILILGDHSDEQLHSHDLLIYDFINTSLNQKLICNKIKFCQSLYKKELQHESNMQRLLYVDGLTKRPNRAKLIQDIIKNEDLITSLAILDINDFKEVNDFYGLKVGDYILKGVVDVIEETIQFMKEKISLYKFSADVYCLANKGLDKQMFEDIITYVLGAIDSHVFHADGHEIDIKAKAGLTFSSKKNKLITADIALQAAKKTNKDYIVFYEELDNVNEYKNNMFWTKKLKRAMDSDNIIVYYQPLVNNQTMNVDKYECLVRMYDDEDDKVVSPFFFLEISKKANQYSNITKIVIEKSFKEFENLPFEFSVNVSYEDIEDKYFLYFIEEKLKKYNVASRVTWEILEDESIRNYDILIEFINKVKSFGCKVSIDDFGSGYSNFEHLLKMDVDYLKIDASLIKNITTDENSYKVVKTVIDFANSLNLKTIAEYVENEEIFEKTKQLGANYSQGYYFSAPLPKPDKYKY